MSTVSCMMSIEYNYDAVNNGLINKDEALVLGMLKSFGRCSMETLRKGAGLTIKRCQKIIDRFIALEKVVPHDDELIFVPKPQELNVLMQAAAASPSAFSCSETERSLPLPKSTTLATVTNTALKSSAVTKAVEVEASVTVIVNDEQVVMTSDTESISSVHYQADLPAAVPVSYLPVNHMDATATVVTETVAACQIAPIGSASATSQESQQNNTSVKPAETPSVSASTSLTQADAEPMASVSTAVESSPNSDNDSLQQSASAAEPIYVSAVPVPVGTNLSSASSSVVQPIATQHALNRPRDVKEVENYIMSLDRVEYAHLFEDPLFNLHASASYFFDQYEAKDWMIKQEPIKNWHSVLHRALASGTNSAGKPLGWAIIRCTFNDKLKAADKMQRTLHPQRHQPQLQDLSSQVQLLQSLPQAHQGQYVQQLAGSAGLYQSSLTQPQSGLSVKHPALSAPLPPKDAVGDNPCQVVMRPKR